MSSCAARCLTRLLSAGITVGLLCGLTGCGGQQPQSDTSDAKSKTQQTLADSNVAIFTPSDGISISQHTPLNKWTKLVPQLNKALTDQGVRSKNIYHHTDGDLESQTTAVKDFVSSNLSSKAATQAKRTTLIVAPVIKIDSSSRQYGDYFTSSSGDIDGNDKQSNSTNENGANSDQTGTNIGGDTGQDEQHPTSEPDSSQTTGRSDNEHEQSSQSVDQQSTKRLANSLKLAQRSGAHVVVLSNPIDGVNPDVFVNLSDAQAIGRMQAMQLTSKLALDQATSNHPKSIEVLLPANSDDTNDSGTSSGKKDGTTSDEGYTSAFNKDAFAAIWDVLEPYFKDGRAVSPSGLLTPTTTKNDWKNLVIDASKTSQIKSAVDTRLTDSKGVSMHVDGIIAMNDFVSSAVVDELSALKYTGSSADINPDISVSGIVGSLTGRQEVNRQPVPAPRGSNSSPQSSDGRNTTSGKDDDKAPVDLSWPIVTGYGAYIDMLPHIVDGAQWMTGLENIDKIGRDIAQVTVNLTLAKPIKALPFISGDTTGSDKVPTIHEELVAVSANNLKTTLIDPGYISLADAGL
jgi:hypothetical protein